ncbi:3-hydroxybutyryl-CoA dehydrogenase [Lentzea guizhouensis]|uniref:3-hydroxybutyryl-CoA dehydrogenase n=1 Tax=Lentzea guizhouensis TaxID=1586287 RepID=A0A1B2HS74_9PSEU|nr:3-hydroxyacyl-CoA dehydrogenase NAD-binding domain-containing protein [Lentzea guizhouensis]ANZ40538.1 3-hydroxybutyryl-CoA dehydrogenase [Lentzea guizhouensis]
MKRIGVAGAGTMGIGVAQLFAQGGHEVVLVDVAEEILDRARRAIDRAVFLGPLVRPHAEHHPPDEVLGRITFTTALAELEAVDFVVENVTEDWRVKSALYPQLDQVCAPGTAFGVNTSAIPITKVAALTGRPDRVIGTHFMNPAPLKPTVEVVRGTYTSPATIEETTALLAGVGKACVVVGDSPGFVTNRVAMLTVNEAVFLLWEGVASAPDIDRLFRQCFGHAMGPLATADLIGLDTVLRSLEVLYDEFNDPKYRPCPLLRSLVYAGRTGRKAGQGFHTYEQTEPVDQKVSVTP